MRNVTVVRRTWVNGNNRGFNEEQRGSSALLNENGFMCCVGQIGLALGMDPDKIRDIGTLADVAEQHGSASIPAELKWMIQEDTVFDSKCFGTPDLASRIYGDNDRAEDNLSCSEKITREEREQRIKAHFLVAPTPLNIIFID